MTQDELKAIISGGESPSVEFKRSTGQRTKGVATVCGMLNGQGGFVLFGVTDDGRVRGQQVATSTLESVVGELRKIEPHALLEPELIDVEDGKQVVAIRVPAGGSSRPYVYDGRPYAREGPTTVVMPQSRYRRMLVERTHPTDRWETQPAHRIGIDDLDHAEITRTVDEAIRRGRMEEPGIREPAALLQGLGLLEDGDLLNAAVVLFGNADRLVPFYPQCVLRMARFRGTDKSAFEDNRQEVGHAFELFRRGQRFLRDHLPVAGRIVPGLFEREDDPLYPLEALREVLANAICHRDYAVGGGSISIAIYDDRLEVSSVGGLRFGLTVDDLIRPHTSRPWNPLIAKVFYVRGIIETWGRGTIKMAELTKRAGLPPPEFEEAGGALHVRFFPTGYVPPSRVGHDLSDLQRTLLEVLAQIGPAALSEIRAALPDEVPVGTVQDNLQMLRRLELIELKGKRRWARWMLKGTDA